MPSSLLSRLGLVSISLFSTLTFAAVDPCERVLLSSRPITLRSLKELSAERIAAAERITPRPGFTDIAAEASREQVGQSGPLALQQFLSTGQSFVSTPAPTASDVSSVNLVEEGRSVVLHADIDWEGQRTSTALYVSLPAPKILSAGKYLVGPEYPIALVFLHGGGTPTATGKNGMTLGEKLVPLNIPVVSLDMPGHGRATRKVKGFSTFKQQVDWLMQILEQNIHPNVKLVLSGHSWGGEFAVYMHRLSKDPRYARILKYIAVSPPVDVSLGGDVRKKIEFEQWYEQHYPEFKDRIGESDFEFRENLLRNGKDSDIGAYHTAFTFMDYMLPVLTPEQKQELKPFSIAVGTADGMVYVGYEKAFEALFGDMPAEDYLLLGPGDTWKGKNQPTAHNVWDRYTDGTTTLQMYSWLGQQVLDLVGGQKPEVAQVDEASEVLDSYFRNYANFFAFRELVENSVEFMRVENPLAVQLGHQKRSIDEFLKRVEARVAAAPRETDEQIRKDIEGLRQELQLEGMSLSRARQEVEMKPLTEARRQELETFVAKINVAEAKLRQNFTDSDYDHEIVALRAKYQKLMDRLAMPELESYKAHLERLTNQKERSKEEESLRSDLSRLHQDMSRLQKQKQERFGVERDAIFSTISAPAGILDHKMAIRELKADHSPERRARVQAFVERYPQVEAAARARVKAKIAQEVAAVPHPEGLADAEQARRRKAEIDAMLSFTYAPNVPEIDKIAHKILALSEEQFAVLRGDEKRPSMDRLESSVWDLRIKRNKLVHKKWSGIWAKGDLTSSEIQRKAEFYEKALNNYKQVYFRYTQLKSEWLLELKQSGRLESEVVLAGTPELKSMLRKLVNARSVFFDSLDDFETVKWSEAIAGHLQGPEGLVKEAQKVAVEVWGEDYVKTHQASTGSLTLLLRMEEEYLETRRREESLLERQINELRVEYSQKMKEQGIDLPSRVERVNIYQHLNRPLKDLLADLRKDRVLLDAMSRTLNKWEKMHSELRREVQLKGNVE